MGAIYPDLADRGVLVTGGARGIGAAIVEAFVGQKARVGFIDFDLGAGERLSRAGGDGRARRPSRTPTSATSRRCRRRSARSATRSGRSPCSSTTPPTTTGTRPRR